MYFIEMTLAVYHGNKLLFIVIVIVIVIIHALTLMVVLLIGISCGCIIGSNYCDPIKWFINSF